MLSLYEYNQVEKKPIKIKLHGRNLTLTKADYIISDVDDALDIIVKNVKLYFYQKYNLLIQNMKNNRLYNHFDYNYKINNEIAFYHLFNFIDDANTEVFHLLNRLGINDANINLINWNSDVIKKNYYDTITNIINKIYDHKYELDQKYKKAFDMSSGKYADIIVNNFNKKYEIVIDTDLNNYNQESLFNYYNELVDKIIDKTLWLYKNTMLLLITDYIKNLDETFNDIYNKMTEEKFINSIYEINESKDYAKSVMSFIYKYPFTSNNYYLISHYINPDEFEDYKQAVEYLGISKNLTDIMNVDNHNFIYNNFSLDGDLVKYKEYVDLYCYVCGENVLAYITRHMLLIQKEEIDKLLMMIENEADPKKLNLIYEQILEKNKKFEHLLNKSCMTPAEINAIDRKVNEQKSSLKHEMIIRTLMLLVALGIIIYEIIRISK